MKPPPAVWTLPPQLVFAGMRRRPEEAQGFCRLVQRGEGGERLSLTPEAGTVKTGSYRDVPLHSHLIDQGFLDFVKDEPDGPLFYAGSATMSATPWATTKGQFDWSHEIALIGGVTTQIKVAHVRLCHSRLFLLRAYPRETQEMVFDAHEQAFRFFGGACRRGIYDNMRTAVATIFVGRQRVFNRRFQQFCSHHLVEPTACNPNAGWEKGQVENQVRTARNRFFKPTPRHASL